MRKIFSSKTHWFVALLLAAAFVFGFASCSSDSDDDDDNTSDPLSGTTYKLTKVVSSEYEEGLLTFSINGTTITITAEGSTTTTIISVTKNGDLYSATGTENGEPVTDTHMTAIINDLCNTTEGTSAILYKTVSSWLDETLTFNNGTFTESHENISGAYKVSGTSCIMTADGESKTATTSDGWKTFVMNEDSQTMTFTKQ